MAANFILGEEAEKDLDEAYAWYERQRVGLGEEFLSSVDACIHSICRMPQAHATVFHNFRRALVRRFPYAVFYEYDNEIIAVYGVMHTAQDPNKEEIEALLDQELHAVRAARRAAQGKL